VEQQLTLDRAEFDAVILDLDGLAAAGLPAPGVLERNHGSPSSMPLGRLRQQGFALGVTAAEPSAFTAFDAQTLQRCFHTVVRPGEASHAASRTASARSRLAEAARRLGVAPVRAVAVLGRARAIADARAEGFGLVVGMADAEQGAALLRAGAHRVIDRLSALRPAGTVLPPSALARVGEIRAAAAGKHLAVFLDYDGTLTPIAGRPEDANLDAETRSALGWLIERIDADCLPVYLGDDITDEDAFHAVRARGLGIIVACAPVATAARFRLDDTRAVRRFLKALTEPGG
jgi:alpha,alpha-trehalase